MKLSEATERYLAAHANIRAEKTKTNHRQNVRRIVAWLGRDPEVTELDDETLARWFANREKSVARNTVNSEGQGLVAVLKWCSRKGWCEWPDARPPQRIRRLPQALTLAQTVALIDAAQTLKGNFRGVPACVRWRAYLLLALTTGERIGAVKQLEWRDIGADVVVFRPETRKGGCTEAAHRLPAQVVDAMAALKSWGEPTPFGWMLRTDIYAHWRALMVVADLPEWCRPHTLRKTAASHCATLEDARRLLGHASSATTAANYRDPRVASQESPTQALINALEAPKRRGWFGLLTG